MVLLANSDHSEIVGHDVLAMDDHLLNVGDADGVDIEAPCPYDPHSVSFMFEASYHGCQVQNRQTSLEKSPALVYFTIFKAAVANSPKVGSTLKYLSCFFSTQVGQSSQVLLVEHCCGALGCPKTFLSVHKECNLEREFITNILWNPREKK